MITNEELIEWLLENRVDNNGDLRLDGLDFSEFDGDVYISMIKVANDLHQDGQEVGGDLTQYSQKVGGNLYQGHQEVGGDLHRGFEEVKGDTFVAGSDKHSIEKVDGIMTITYRAEDK